MARSISATGSTCTTIRIIILRTHMISTFAALSHRKYYQVWTVCYGCCPLHHHAVFPSLQDSEPTNKIQIISTTKMPTHLTDSKLARFRTNPLEPFDKVNIGIKSILASHVIQSRNLANALDRHNICSWVFLFAQHKQEEHDFPLIVPSLNSTYSSTRMRPAWSSMIQFMRLFLQFTWYEAKIASFS